MVEEKVNEKRKGKKYLHKRKPSHIRNAAVQMIDTLFSEAEKIAKKYPDTANRYVKVAKKIAMKAKIKMPSIFKRRSCKFCHTYLIPGKNCIIRLKQGNIIYSCGNCKKLNKFGYTKEQKEIRKNKKKSA